MTNEQRDIALTDRGGYSRNSYIDILRGIGIASIVIGHVLNTDNFTCFICDRIREFLYYFHIPIFFFCSGYCWKEKKVGRFLLDTIKKQYILFVLICMISILISPLWVKLNVLPLTEVKILYRITTVLKFANGGIFTGPLWFVPFFVFAQFWYYALQRAHAFLMKKLPEKYWLWVTLEIMISGILGIVTVSLFGVGKRRFLLAITMVPLMKIGSAARENWRKIEIILKKNFLWILLAVMSILLIADACGFQIELSKGIIGEYDGLLFYPIVFVGIVFCLSLAELIQNLKLKFIFENLGRMSFWVMALHCMVFKTLDGIAGIIMKTGSDVLTLFPYSFPELRLIYILLGLSLPMIVGWTCKKISYSVKKLICRKN